MSDQGTLPVSGQPERGGHTEPDYEGTRLAEILGSRAEPLIMPADEFAALRTVAVAAGMASPSPVPSGGAAEATGAAGGSEAAAPIDLGYMSLPADVHEAVETDVAIRRLTARAEAAEAKLAAIAAHCRARMKGPGRSGISLSAATLILGIAEGSDEEAGHG